MMESIEKLRMWSEYYTVDGKILLQRDEIGEVADEIEREITERYIPRHVDGKGVAICSGDEVRIDYVDEEGKVISWNEELVFVRNTRGITVGYPPSSIIVKSDTVESLLKEFGQAYTYVDGECASTSVLISDYADKFRALLGGDAE